MILYQSNNREDDFTSDKEERFKRYDKDGDGFVTHQELKDFATKRRLSITDREIEEMIKDADTNKDGKVSFEEYKAMMNKLGTVYIRTLKALRYSYTFVSFLAGLGQKSRALCMLLCQNDPLTDRFGDSKVDKRR